MPLRTGPLDLLQRLVGVAGILGADGPHQFGDQPRRAPVAESVVEQRVGIMVAGFCRHGGRGRPVVHHAATMLSRIGCSTASPKRWLRAAFQPTRASGRLALSLKGISRVSDRQP